MTSFFQCCRLLFALSLFPGWEGLLWADGVTVGNPLAPEGLSQAVSDAYAHGARDITIAPGTYDLPSMNHRPTFLLDGWTDATVHAAGVTLIFENLGQRPVYFRNCNGVSWDDGTLLFIRPAFTQGRITALGTDEKSNGYCDWKIDAGYTADIDPPHSDFNVVDQTTRMIKVGTGDWAPTRSDQSAPDVLRFHYPASRAPGFAIGDWLVTRAVAGSGIMQLDGCQNCTVKNVILENAGFAAFFETGGAGGNHYLNCKIQPGPRPPGATEDELVGGGADGFHSTGTGTGPDIEDCTFAGVFLDDCIAIHGSFCRVTAQDGNALTLEGPAGSFKVREPLRIADSDGFYAQSKITAIEPQGNRLFKVTLDQNLNVPINPAELNVKNKGTRASDPDHCGQGYKILRCRLGDTRSRGILVKADNGLIDGCTIQGAGMSAVSIGPEFWWGEAGYCLNVLVTNNTFLGCSRNNGDQATVWVHGDGAIGNRNIVIRGNSFSSCYGPFIIKLNWADGVEVSHNHIDKSFQLPLPGPGSVIEIMQCRHVMLLDNVVMNQGASAGALVRLDANESDSDVQNDNVTGIRVMALSGAGG